MIACLDPGHGGYDPGAVGNGLQEKDITLDICLQLKPLLEFNDISVILTRDGDYAPGHLDGNLDGELMARVSIAEQNNADLFVSVHVNSGGGTGQEILVSGAGGRAETVANMVLSYLVQVGGWANRGVKTQNVLVLKETTMPAILTENGFIDNVTDTAKLKDPNFRQALAVAHAKGICDYFGIQYKEKVEGNTVKKVVVYFTPGDYSVALGVANKLGSCAMFCRNGQAGVHADAMAADQVFNIGGPELGHKNEVYMSGSGALETATAVCDAYKIGQIK